MMTILFPSLSFSMLFTSALLVLLVAHVSISIGGEVVTNQLLPAPLRLHLLLSVTEFRAYDDHDYFSSEEYKCVVELKAYHDNPQGVDKITTSDVCVGGFGGSGFDSPTPTPVSWTLTSVIADIDHVNDDIDSYSSLLHRTDVSIGWWETDDDDCVGDNAYDTLSYQLQPGIWTKESPYHWYNTKIISTNSNEWFFTLKLDLYIGGPRVNIPLYEWPALYVYGNWSVYDAPFSSSCCIPSLATAPNPYKCELLDWGTASSTSGAIDFDVTGASTVKTRIQCNKVYFGALAQVRLFLPITESVLLTSYNGQEWTMELARASNAGNFFEISFGVASFDASRLQVIDSQQAVLGIGSGQSIESARAFLYDGRLYVAFQIHLTTNEPTLAPTPPTPIPEPGGSGTPVPTFPSGGEGSGSSGGKTIDCTAIPGGKGCGGGECVGLNKCTCFTGYVQESVDKPCLKTGEVLTDTKIFLPGVDKNDSQTGGDSSVDANNNGGNGIKGGGSKSSDMLLPILLACIFAFVCILLFIGVLFLSLRQQKLVTNLYKAKSMEKTVARSRGNSVHRASFTRSSNFNY